jgi:hypothetical protein
MTVDGWSVAVVVASVLVLAGLVLSLVWRGRAPVWLPLVGLLAAVVVSVVAVQTFGSHVAGEAALLAAGTIAWCLIGCALLVVATLAVVRRWTARTAMLIVAFGVLTPLAALFLAVVALTASS